MMRSRFDEQLKRLDKELIEMGAMCEEAIALAAKALLDGDESLAAKVAPLDTEIDQMERDIESMCLKLLLQQQPVARDLRQISAALKMITDMERRDHCLFEGPLVRKLRSHRRDGQSHDQDGHGQRGGLRAPRHGAC